MSPTGTHGNLSIIRVAQLGAIPNELLVEMFLHLHVLDMIRFRSVCRWMKDLIDRSPALQYKLEVFLAGMQTFSYNDDGLNDSLYTLRERQRAWTEFRPASEAEVQNLGFSCISTSFHGNIVAHRTESSIIFSQLPPLQQTYPEQWSIDVSGVPMDYCIVYPEDDLLVAVVSKQQGDLFDRQITGYAVHLLSLNSGAPHPSATNPVISLSFEPRNYGSLSVSVYGDFVALMIQDENWDDKQELWVFNWKSGLLYLNAFQQDEGNKLKIGAQSVEWLNDHLLMMTVVEGSHFYGGQPALFIYDCKVRCEQRLPFQHVRRVATFRFPELVEGVVCNQLYSESDCCLPCYGSSAFRPDPSLRIIAFQLDFKHVGHLPPFLCTRIISRVDWEHSTPIGGGNVGESAIESDDGALDHFTDWNGSVSGGGGGLDGEVGVSPPGNSEGDRDHETPTDDAGDTSNTEYVRREMPIHHLFVHSGTLESFCREGMQDEDIAWEEWASHARFMVKPGPESLWLAGNVSHTRIVIPETRYPEDETQVPEEDEENWPAANMIYDFPPPAALRRAVCLDEDHEPWEYILEPEVLEPGTFFKSKVVSGLPYRKVDTGFVDLPSLADLAGNSSRDDCVLTGNHLYTCKISGETMFVIPLLYSAY